MTEPPNDWKARAELDRETRDAMELAGPMSFGEAFYLTRRAEGLGCMEARFAAWTRDQWPPRSAARPRPRLPAGEILDAIRAGA